MHRTSRHTTSNNFKKNQSRFLPSSLMAVAVASVAATLMPTQSAIAANETWSGATNGLWGTATNWTPNATPTSADAITILGPANVAGALTIDINSAAAAGSINITDTAAAILANITSGADQTLTIGNGTSGTFTTTTGAVTVGSATANQGVLLSLNGNLTTNIGAGGATFNNAISGAFSLTKSAAGTGLLTLNGANTYSGGTFINTGAIRAGSSTALGTGAITIQNVTGASSQLQLTNGVNISNALNMVSGGVAVQGLLYMPVSGSQATYSGTINITGAATAGAHFATVDSATRLTIAGNNTITSTVPVTLRNGYVVYSGSQNYTTGTTLANASTNLHFKLLTSMPATGTLGLTASGTTATVNVGGAGEWSISGTGAGTVAGMLAGIGGQGNTVTMAAGTSLGIDTTNAVGTQTLTTGWTSTNNVGLLKLGTGTLELTQSGNMSGVGAAGFSPVVRQGTLLISGGTHTTTSETVIGGNYTTVAGAAGYDASLVMTGGTLTVGNWFSQGRGNGVGGVSSDVTLSNAASITATNYSAGFNAVTGNTPKGTMTLNNTASFTVTSTANNTFNFAESVGSNLTMNLNDSSTVTDATAGSTGDRSIGMAGTGTINLNGSSVLTMAQDPILGRNATGIGTINVNGTSTFNAGTTATKWLQIGYDGQGILNVNGGTVKVNAGTEMNFSRGVSAQANSVNQNSGNVTFYSDNGVTIGTGGGINMARGGTTATVNTYNLNGGTLTVPQIYMTATANLPTRNFNFNGGTLKAAYAAPAFFASGVVTTANVRNGGAIINTNGFDNTIGVNLTHSAISGDNATDGGLTKLGGGVLTLTGTGTNYTGPTTINGGTLALASGVSLANSAVSVNSGGGIAPGGGNSIVTNSVKSLTFASGSTNYWEFGSGNDQLAAVNTLTVSGGAFGVYQPTASPYSTPFSTNGTYDLVTFPAGGFSGSLTGLSVLPASQVGGKAYSFQLNNATPSLATSLQLIIADATSYAWNGSTSTAWNTGANWNGGAFPNAASLTAAFAGANLTGAANTTASIDASGKTVGAITLDNSGGASSFTISGPGTLTLNNGSSASAISDLAGTHTVSANIALTATTNVTTANASDSLTLSGNISGSQAVNISGTGTVTLSGTNTHSSTTVAGGSLNTNSAGALGTGPATFSGAVTLDNTSAGAVTLTAGSYLLGGDVTFTGTQNLNLGTGAVTMTSSRNFAVNNKTLTVGGPISGAGFNVTKSGNGTLELSGANTYSGATSVNGGVLTVTGSGSISGTTLAVGTVNGVGAAVYQSGTTSISESNTGGGTSAAFRIGDTAGSAGYYNLSGGTVTVGGLGGGSGEFDVGGPQGGSGTFAQLDMSGGTINLPNNGGSYFLVNRGGAGQSAVVNFSGGTVQVAGGATPANSNFNGLAMGLNNVGTLISTITFSGSAQFLTPSLSTKLNCTNFGASSNTTNISVLNMNGGTLQTLGFNTASLATGGNGNAVINFNGGTIKAGTANNANYLSSVAEAHVFSGGGTIDNNGRAITIGQALLAASGSGVTTVPVLTGGSGYVTPPQVSFGGGSLANGLISNTATGYATIDPSTGAVTGIVITNPGSYTDTSGLTAFLSGPTNGTAATIDVPTYAGNVSGGMTFTGSSTTTLTGINTYTGATTINGGTVLVSGTGEVNGSSSVVVNGTGAVFATSSSTAVSAPVTVTNGKVDGTGTINSITVASNATNTITNGLGTSSQLTIGSLTFSGNGALTANVSSPTTVGINVTGGIGTAGPATVAVNATNTTWTNGTTYDLVGYGTGLTGGGFGSYTLGTITGLTSRQAATLINHTATSALAISIAGDSPKWTGLDSGQWVVGTTGASKNWKLITAGTATDYIQGDTVLFDDTAAGTTNVQIDTATVLPTTTTFNNSTKNYTVASTGAFGIGGTGSLTKSGTGTLTLNTANTYSGGTVLNAGQLNVNNAAALGTGTVTINGGSLDNTSGSAKVLTANQAVALNADVTFVGTNNLNLGTGTVTLGGTGTTRTITTTAGVLGTGAIINGGTYGVTKAGAGTWFVNGAANSNIGGPLAVNAGTMQIGLFDFKTGYDGAGVSLGTGGLSGTGTIENGSTTTRWLYTSQDTDSTFAGTLQDGSGGGLLGLLKAGNGTLTLSGTNTLTSTMTANAGKILLTGSSSAPVVVTATTGNFEESAAGTINGNASFTSAGTSLIAGTNTYSGATLINGGTTTITGSIAGTSSTTIGQAAGAGVLQVQSTQALGTAALNFDGTGNGSTARLELSNNISLNNPISLPGRNSSTIAIQNTGGTNTLSGPITINVGGGGYWISSDAGTTLNLSGGITSAAGGTRTISLMGDGNGTESGAIANGTAVTMNLNKEGAGTWTLSGNNTYNGVTTVNGGVLKTVTGIKNGNTVGINNNAIVEVPLNGGASAVTAIGTLAIGTSNSRIELHDNDLVLNYGTGSSSYTDTVNKVKSGLVLLGGTGTEGISSAEVDAQSVQGTILAVVDDGDANIGGAITATSGYTLAAPTTSVIVKYTWFGDSNLDGQVDGSDYALLDSGFTSGGSLGGWVFGDYDYSGQVDGSDYALIDTGFISQNAVLPEPTTLGLLGLGAMGALRRRRRAN